MFAVTGLPSAPVVPGKVRTDAGNNFLQSAVAEGEGAAGGGERNVGAHDLDPPPPPLGLACIPYSWKGHFPSLTTP